jgi:8-oxo-dGTP pyrophosphatase MutT (NUDIX family)
MKPFKILSKELLVDSPFCRIEKQLVELPDGSTADWYVSLNTDAVIVIPVLKDGSVILQQQYKHGGGEIVTEFCAGMVDEGETTTQAAARELQEETGYTAEEFIHLKTVFSNPTGSRMKYHYFLAKNAELTSKPNLEPAEQIELLQLPSLKAAREHLLKPETLTTAGMIGALSLVEPLL